MDSDLLQGLIDHVGAERYAAARTHAWRSAAGTGRASDRADETDEAGAKALISVVADLLGLTWKAPARTEEERLARAMVLYRDLPSYAVLMYGTAAYRGFGAETRGAFWAAYRALLSDADDRLADPVAYSLWCDYFEGARTVEEAWRGLDPDTLPPRGLERLLETAGPVPWALKEPLYQRLLPDTAWHGALCDSLVRSRFDVYGQIDPPRALRLLNRLRLARGTEGLAELRARLEAEVAKPAAKRSTRRRR